MKGVNTGRSDGFRTTWTAVKGSYVGNENGGCSFAPDTTHTRGKRGPPSPAQEISFEVPQEESNYQIQTDSKHQPTRAVSTNAAPTSKEAAYLRNPLGLGLRSSKHETKRFEQKIFDFYLFLFI